MKVRTLAFFGKSRVNHRTRGDGARDRKDWKIAEEAYSKYLEGCPLDFPIWIQLGHSLKEQGKLAEAVEAYCHGLSLRPEDEDAAIHLAYLLKRMKRPDEAGKIFGKLFRQSGSREMYRECAEALPGTCVGGDELSQTARTLNQIVTYFELDDLFHYLMAHRTVSGIQRVQLGVVEFILSKSEMPKQPRHIFVLNEPGDKWLWQIQKEDLRSIIQYLETTEPDHDYLKSIIRRARDNAVAVIASSGQVYFILGAFWAIGSVAQRYHSLKRAGVIIGTYLYDLIPITHAEFCDEELPHEFTLALGDGLNLFDFILTISEYTAREIRLYIEREKLPQRPVQAVPLAHSREITTNKQPKPWGSAIEFLKDRRFVLMVSTIEARKNHNFLVMAWKHFLDEELNPPDLVFVGREGWRVTSLMELLRTTHYLDGRVHVLHDLSDADLNTLYNACLFTAFPSFVEGWGLPVGESLARGKPCVASSTSSIPEVGGALVDYVDPLNLRDGIHVLHRMMFNDTYRDQRSAAIREKFKPRIWSDVAASLLHHVDRRHGQSPSHPNADVLFPSGAIFRPGDLAFGRRLPTNYARHPWRMMLVDSWQRPELAGCWMAGPKSSLTFKSDLPSGSGIVAYVRIIGAPWASSQHRISITIGCRQAPTGLDASIGGGTPVQPGKEFSVRAEGQVGDNGLVTISFEIAGNTRHQDQASTARLHVAGLASVGYIAPSSAEMRAAFLEKFLMAV